MLEFKQVEGFLGDKKLSVGKQKKIQIGIVALNYYCDKCTDIRTFRSLDELFCIGVNDNLVSIDCVLNCYCGASVQMWFLVDCVDNICGRVPEVRILKRSEKLSTGVLINKEQYGEFSEFLEKSKRAHREGLGAGAMVYLRKVFEQITLQTATAARISPVGKKGGDKPFRNLLEEVDKQCTIIPREFSENGYRLFGELSDIVHGDYDEELALIKYEALHRLIIGILDGVKNNNELMEAIGKLGWNEGSAGDE
jgi:hypothetical protein